MAYDLQSAHAPRMVGRTLAVAASALDHRVTASLLIPKLLRDSGVETFRRTPIDDAPSVLPPLPRRGDLPAAEAGAPADPFALAESARAGGRPFETTADYLRAYRERRTTPTEVAARLVEALRRADAMTPPLAAILAWREDDLMAQAQESAARWRDGKPRSPLDGVPIAVKDELHMTPYPTGVGTSFIAEQPAEDAAMVGRLRAAGALLYGKANMIELGIDTIGFNAHHGTPKNPWADEHRYSGGSSSGSAVAVAAGLGPIAIGADGGGSIRIPAALCGVAGLKATHGRISERGVFPLCWSVGHVGPIGATVRDVAIAYRIVAGPVDGDPVSQGQPPVAVDGLGADRIDGVRIGVYRPWFDDAAPAVVAACQQTLDRLVERGATVVDIEIPDLELLRVAHVVTILSEMATTMDAYAEHRTEHGLAVRMNLAVARALTGRDYVRAQMVRTRASRHFARAFERCDVIATPTTGITAPPVRPDVLPRGESDLETLSALMRFVFPMNMTGHPALSVPAGQDADGLPVGLQLTGRPWDESLLLRVGEVVERLAPRGEPKLHFRLLS